MESTGTQELLEKLDLLTRCPSFENILRTLASFMIGPLVGEFLKNSLLGTSFETSSRPLYRVTYLSNVLADSRRGRRKLLFLFILLDQLL